MQTDPPATAENPPATHGKPPATTETQPQTTTTPLVIESADDLEGIESLDQLTAMMAAGKDVPFENSTKPKWQAGFRDGEEQAPEAQPEGTEPTDAGTAAQPGESTAETETETAPTEEEQEQAPKAAAMPKKEANNVRLKRERFGPETQPIIDLMAVERHLSFDEAKAKLISEGKIMEKAESGQPKAETPPAPVTSPDIAAQQAIIADLEAKITEAGTTYDTAAIAKLTVEHNKALHALNRLETKAELAAETQKAQGATQKQTAVAQAETDAVGMFPDAGVEGSALYEAIADLMDEAPASAFEDPDYPLTFAAKAARKIGYRPPPKAASATPPVLVPKRPARQVLPASGASAQAAAQAAQATIEQETADAGEDLTKLTALLDKASGRRAA